MGSDTKGGKGKIANGSDLVRGYKSHDPSIGNKTAKLAMYPSSLSNLPHPNELRTAHTGNIQYYGKDQKNTTLLAIHWAGHK